MEDAKKYLHKKTQFLIRAGIDVMTQIVRGDPSTQIARIARGGICGPTLSSLLPMAKALQKHSEQEVLP